MRRSSVHSEAGASGPLRVKQDPGSVTKQRSRISLAPGSSSSFGNRARVSTCPSSTSSNRKVSISRGHGSETMKDPRPVNDKVFKDKSIRSLVQFLVENGYPHPISPKLLVSPSGKDFFKIFEFMYSLVEPRFKYEKKMEEEITDIFKQLGYPFSISKSALHSVGAPHVWPALLAALSWLRQHIEQLFHLDPTVVAYSELDGAAEEENKIFFLNTAAAYSKFMSGDDTFEEEDEDLEKQLRHRGDRRDLNHLQQENKNLKTTLETLLKEPDQVLHLKEVYASLEQDMLKLKEYLTNLEQHVDKREQGLHALTHEHHQLEEECSSLKAEIQRMQDIYEQQEFSQEDVQRINMELREIQRKSDALQQENREISEVLWKEEMAIAKAREKVEGKCLEYNKVGQQLQLIPATAENAFGLDYELALTTSINTFETKLKPALSQLRASCQSKLQKQEEQLMLANHSLEQLHEIQAEKEGSMGTVNMKLRRTEELIETKKQLHQSEIATLEEEYNTLHEEVSKLRLRSKADICELKEKLSRQKAKFEKQKLIQAEELSRYTGFLKGAIAMIADHKSEIQEQCERVRDDVLRRANKPLHG